MGKSFQKERIGPYRCCKGILCKDDSDSFEEKGYREVKSKRSQVEFDHEKLATILVSPGIMGSREYVKDAWEESKYIKPLEITEAEEEAEKEEENQTGFDWEAMIDEVATEGESGSERSFMMPRKKLKALRNYSMRFQAGYTRPQLSIRTRT
ncbi:hypothetical protein Dimus_035932 [Dionaea muscipula]